MGISKNYNKKKGILCILMAAFSFALMTLFVRLAGDVPTMEKCVFRNLPAVFVAFYILQKNHITAEEVQLTKDRIADLFFRCFFGCTGMIANFMAIDHIGLSDSNMLNKMSPFFAMLFSIFLLKEVPSKLEWLLLALAFCGAMLVVKPTGGMASAYHFIGLYGGFAAGMAYTFVRRLGLKQMPGPVIVFTFSMFTCLACLPSTILHFVPLSLSQFLILLLAGCAGAAGQFAITAAYEAAPAKEISIYDYTQVVFAALLGFVILGELPDLWSLLGYAVIIGCAVARWKHNGAKAA